jgi:hypothetical protein
MDLDRDNVEDMSVVDTFLDELGLEEGKKDEIISIIKGMGEFFKSVIYTSSLFHATCHFRTTVFHVCSMLSSLWHNINPSNIFSTTYAS